MTSGTGIDRRRLLQLAGSAATALWLPRSAWSQAQRFTSDPFALGVASGSPLHDSVVLWTRLVSPALGNDAVTVQWEVAHDEAFSRIAQRGQAQALAELAHSVHAEVGGLEPDRWYFYRFIAGGVTSPVGRTRTFPAPDAMVQSLRFAYASCQRWEHGYFSAYRHMREEKLDAVIFLGDYIYEYAGAANPVRVPPGGWVTTLEGYRQRYALHKGEAELQAMHAACPWVVTWDDHEVQNDYAGVTAGNSGPAVPDFAARRAAAYQAFYEHMPVRASALTRAVAGLQAGAEVRLYSHQRLGRLGSLIVLDDRQYRGAQACSPGGRLGSATLDPATCAAWDDPARTLLGAAQEAWVDGAFAQANTGWTVVAQQTLFGRRDFKAGPGQSLWNDGWDGYAAARGRFSQSLQKNRVANPVLLGGDVHENWVGHVKADYDRADSATIGVELCGTSISSRSGGNARIAEVLAENPHFVFAEASRKGYGIAEFTPGKMTATLRVVDDVTRRDTKIETLAQFTTQAASNRLERV
ncbi:MAG: alkaline phosphatase D family protein [Pseudomonadota bacterium]